MIFRPNEHDGAAVCRQTADHVGVQCRRRHVCRRRGSAVPSTTQPLERRPEVGAHPKVDERIVAAVAHRKPVRRDPDDLYMPVRPDGRVGVASERHSVQRQPAQRVDDHHGHHHFHHLKQVDTETMLL